MSFLRISSPGPAAAWFVAVFIAIFVAVVTGPRASVGTEPAMGVQFHGTWSNYSDAERIAVLDKLAEAGVGWVRIDMGWASFQENGAQSYSQWYVDLVDRLVNEAQARGIKVLGTLWATPSWANGGQGTAVPPSDDALFASFARWASNHFRGRVAAWEVWNEPNSDSFFAGTPARYASLLKAAYPATQGRRPQRGSRAGRPVATTTPIG